ncbi:hypothetical protein [Streptomyces sp. SID13031]|uniref:hypothetical protein n=1 Tax=Streptomyces sp. SID13031 TaxID=2706046 RepID=UPI0013C5C12F|nr:hypothetical protein [Streptomyces sp. SID13031]NEA31978.1 hypothetical protein [Streptomyces sp. SID13031]
MTTGEPVRVEVDGQLFDVRVDRPGHYHFDWVSGPNAGYGFSSATSDASPLTPAAQEESIRSFLKQVDPVTGYIE